MKKRLFALVLCLSMLLMLLPASANAAVLAGMVSKVDYDNTDPNKYVVEVDLVNQVITAYNTSGGIMIQGLCTTGNEENPTGSGVFKMGALKERFGYFVAYGQYAQYWSQVIRGVYIHSVMYDSTKLSSMSSSAYKNLGKNVSHGCIRVLPEVAQWIYYNCPPGTTCRIVKNKAADPSLVRSLKAAMPAQSDYVQPADNHADPAVLPGTINQDSVPVRTGFSTTKDSTVATLHLGDHVQLLQLANDWCKVRTAAGKLGYVKTTYITCYPDDVRTESGYAATKKTYVYSEKSRSSETLATIPKGAAVYVSEQIGDSWLYGSYNGVEGYLRTKYVKPGNTLVYPNADGTWPDGSAPKVTAPAAQAEGSSGAITSSTGMRVRDSIIANVRSGPGTGYPVIAELAPGTQLTVTSQVSNWYLCDFAGGSGYVYYSNVTN